MQPTAQNLVEDLHKLGEIEKRVLAHFIHRKQVAKDSNAVFDESLTFGQRIADKVASFGGSWTFIFIFLGFMAVWMVVNSLMKEPYDTFPFILLNLMLSCLAALQAPVIMMSQNRQSVKDRMDAQHDYEVNLKAETEIVALHLKMDELRERQWQTLMEMQDKQLELLSRLEKIVKQP